MFPGTIIISRTDSIGDVVLTFPVAGFLKEKFTGCRIIFLGRSYTEPVIRACQYVDDFIDWSGIEKGDQNKQAEVLRSAHADAIIHVFPVKAIAVAAYKARIPLRIGTTGRVFHWATCNKLIPFSRRRSGKHESQLNLELLHPFGIPQNHSLEEISGHYGFAINNKLPPELKKLISKKKFNLILHPLSKGSSREWGLKNFRTLIEILPSDLFSIFITGTKEEGIKVKEHVPVNYPNVTDLTGKLTLAELIGFIAVADGLVAASTGPLHIAAALGRHAIGLYPPIKPLHPGRWAPVGKYATYLVKNGKCNSCRRLVRCECIEKIAPGEVKDKLMKIINQ